MGHPPSSNYDKYKNKMGHSSRSSSIQRSKIMADQRCLVITIFGKFSFPISIEKKMDKRQTDRQKEQRKTDKKKKRRKEKQTKRRKEKKKKEKQTKRRKEKQTKRRKEKRKQTKRRKD